MPTWRGLLNQLIEDNPTWGEEDVAWRLIEEMGLRGAELLMPIFERDWAIRTGVNGFLENPLGGWAGTGNPGGYNYATTAPVGLSLT